MYECKFRTYAAFLAATAVSVLNLNLDSGALLLQIWHAQHGTAAMLLYINREACGVHTGEPQRYVKATLPPATATLVHVHSEEEEGTGNNNTRHPTAGCWGST